MNMNEFEQRFNAKFHCGNNQPRVVKHNVLKGNTMAAQKDVAMTWEQKNFCTYMNQALNSPKEFVVFLQTSGAEVRVTEVRGVDFSLKKSYKRYLAPRRFEEVKGVVPLKGNWKSCSWFRGTGYYVITWRFAPPIQGDLCPVELDPSGYAAPFTAEQMVKAIRKAKFDTPSFSADETSGLYETLAKQLQRAGDEIFIYELLQNASDKPADENSLVDIRIQIVPSRVVNGKRRGGYLGFCHTGSCFDPQDVAAICSANQKSKMDVGKIGYKGIGFKTVFHYSKRVEIRSGDFGFAFDEKTLSERPDIPWMTTPSWVHPNTNGNYRVDIRLFPRDPDLKLSNGEGSYRSLLEKLFKDERALLFIPRINKLELCIDGEQKVCSPAGGRWCRSRQYEEALSQELRTRIAFEIGNKKSASRIPPKYATMEKAVSMFACRVVGRKLIPEDVNSSYLYCYLPASAAHWGLPFLMNTDMVPDGNRSNIEYSIDENKDFAAIAGRAFYKWICELIASAQYDYDTIFQLIPDFDDCKKNRVDEEPFIEAFQAGFEESLCPKFQIPGESGRLVDAESVYVDIIGALKMFGPSLAKEICGDAIPYESLWDCPGFIRFVKRYHAKLGVKLFDWENLKLVCKGTRAQEWLKAPDANNKFIEFLLDKSVVEKFTDIPIFLDNRGGLGGACDLYSYGEGVHNVEKYLPRFVRYARYLSPKVTYHDKLKGVKFKGFGPRTFLVENVLSQAVINNTREALKEIEVAKGFWSFITHYRMWDGKERFVDDYVLLGGLPFITETGDVCESFVSDEFSVYIADDHSDPKILGYEWFKSRVRFVNHKYFEGEKGADIKDFLTSKLFAGGKCLAGKVELADVMVRVFDRFKEKILGDVRSAQSDMGVYDFLSSCVANGCFNKDLLERHISQWPVLDEKKGWIERKGKSVWHYNKLLIDILNNRWIKGDEFIVLSQKYLAHRSLFDILGAKDFESEGFGEFFRKEICCHLNRNCTVDDLVAFHKYMQTQVLSNKIVNDAQLDALKKTPVIVHTKDGVRPWDGCEGVLICQKPIDVPLEISEGRLPATAKVLDSRLCGTDGDEMMRYWHEKLGCQILDEEARLGKTIEAYVERQRLVSNGVSIDEEFKRRHVDFVRSMICRQEVEPSCLKEVKLIGLNGCLAAPKDLVLSEVYNPKCHFQKYGCDLNYVSECYSETPDRTRVAELLRKLGVRDEFQAQDVGCLSVESFCKYYWTEYVASHAPDDEVIKAMKDNPSILDRTGCVRKPSELYSACLEHPYLAKIGDANKLLPLCEGVNTKFYENLDFMDSLTASDAISFLLEDSDGTDYQFRGRALGWIANGNLLPADKERYRKDERAAWRNLKNGQMTHVEKLCVIKSHGANRVRAHFGNSGFVMDLRNICNGEQQIGKGDIERAFEKLGVVLVDNSTLEPLPSGEAVDGCIKNDVKVRLLILLAVSGEDNWAEEYAKKESVLDGCSFKICDSIVESCAVFAQLKSEHGKFSEKDGVAYYVGGWQDKHVFLDVVKYLKMRLGLGDQYTDEDLKEAFDTDGGDRGLAGKILSEGDRLLRNDVFMQMLQGVSPGVWQAVKDQVVELERKKLSQKDHSNEEPHDKVGPNVEQEEDSLGASQGEKSPTVLSLNDTENNSPPEHDLADHDIDKDGDAAVDKRRKGLEEKYGNIEDEEYELLKLMDDDLSLEEKQDQNKLACIRLFRHLQAAGLEPSMYGSSDPEHVVRTLYAEFRRGPNININTGKTVHVISAMGGLAYFPPRWWRSLTTQFDGTKEICIMYGARAGEFKFVRQYSDVLQLIDNKAIIVKISGQDADERMSILSKMFDNVEAPGKVYGLLKMRDAGDRYKWAFMNKILDTTDEENHLDEVISKEEY